MRHHEICEGVVSNAERILISEFLTSLGIREENVQKYLSKADDRGYCAVALTDRGHQQLSSRQEELFKTFGSKLGIATGVSSKGTPTLYIWARTVSLSGKNLNVWGETSRPVPQPVAPDLPMAGSTPWVEWPREDRPYITCHEAGGAVWIDMFEVPSKVRGYGVGAKFFKDFEQKIPTGTILKLMAADAGDGPSDGFWKKMGFKVVSRGGQGTIMTKVTG